MSAQPEFFSIDAPEAKLLFVDDEANILTALTRLFRPEGYKIFTANNGKEGLAILEKEEIDIIISDMRMPEMDGAEFLKRAHQTHPDTPKILLTGYADIASTISAINDAHLYLYAAKPWDDHDLKLVIKRAAEQRKLIQQKDYFEEQLQQKNAQLAELNNSLEQRVIAKTEELRQTNLFLESAHKELKDSYSNSIEVFSNLVELRGDRVAGHSKRVAQLARELAKLHGCNTEETDTVYFAGLLHEIGKIGLPDKLINKPECELSNNEKQVYETYAALGQTVIMGIDALADTGLLIRSHHEQFDGKGFPDRLHAEKIPLGSRIIAIANDYDDLIHTKKIGKVLNKEDAKNYIIKHKNTKYDPKLVDTFCENIVQLEGALSDSDEIAVALDDLKPGMTLTRDVLTPDGIMLLSQGHQISAALVERLKSWGSKTGISSTFYVKGE